MLEGQEQETSKAYHQNVRQFMGEIERDRGPSLSTRAMLRQDVEAERARNLFLTERAKRQIGKRGKVRRVA